MKIRMMIVDCETDVSVVLCSFSGAALRGLSNCSVMNPGRGWQLQFAAQFLDLTSQQNLSLSAHLKFPNMPKDLKMIAFEVDLI